LSITPDKYCDECPGLSSVLPVMTLDGADAIKLFQENFDNEYSGRNRDFLHQIPQSQKPFQKFGGCLGFLGTAEMAAS